MRSRFGTGKLTDPFDREGMVPLNVDSRQTIYAGANFVFAPKPTLDAQRFVDLQAALAQVGLEFDQANRPNSKFVLSRQDEPLQVEIGVPSAAGEALGQLLIKAEFETRPLHLFKSDAEAVCEAVWQVWPEQKQLVRRDATIRQLYDTGGEHAFEYLWADRLQQSVEQLGRFGRPIKGGGLRLVMPPAGSSQTSDEAFQAEVKIESFLQDPSKLWVNVTIAWPQQVARTDGFEVERLLTTTEDFANDEVLGFLQPQTEG